MHDPKPMIAEDEREDFELSEFGEWGEIDDSDETRRHWQEMARQTLEERQDVSIGLSRHDLLRLKAKAAEVGVPYQALISAVLHRYAAGSTRS